MGKFVLLFLAVSLSRLAAMITIHPEATVSEQKHDFTSESFTKTFRAKQTTELSTKVSKYFGTPGPFQVAFLCVGGLGMAANLMVLVVLFASKGMLESYTNKFIANQSLIDFFASFFIVTTNSLREIAPEALGDGLAQDMYCRIWVTRVPLWGTLICSTWNLVALTYERYYGIVYPLHHAQHFTKRKAYTLMATAWFFGLGYQASYAIPTAKSTNWICKNNLYPNKNIHKFVSIFSICIQYVVPLVMIICAYIHIFVTLKRVSTLKLNASVHNPHEVQMRRARRNVILTLLKVFACFVVCWTPNQVIFMAFHLGFELTQDLGVYHTSVLMVFINCCINPPVYTLTYTSFQQAQKAIFCCCMRQGSKQTDGIEYKSSYKTQSTSSEKYSVSSSQSNDIINVSNLEL